MSETDGVTAGDLTEGDRVVLLLPSSEAYAHATLAMLCAGIQPVPLDPALTAAELEPVLADVRARMVVTDEDQLEALRALGPTDLTGALPRARPMHLTSGTTGRRKAVDSGILSRAHAAALVREERDEWRFTPHDVHLIMSPLYHSAPLRFAHGTLLAGGRLVVPGSFDPALMSRAIAEGGVTTTFCVPTHLQRLFAHWDHHGTPNLSGFRLLAHAGAPCPREVKQRLIDVFPQDTTWEFYGSTEGQFTSCSAQEWIEHPGTVGRARRGRRLFSDPDGTLWCVVPDHARFSYFGAPDKTAATWRRTHDGWAFTVGDAGSVDADGYVTLHGRRDDLIITGGVNVYPLEVESALLEAPGVDDVAVYGRPDDTWGTRVCAAVVGTPDPEFLREFARTRLSGPRRPKEYAFLSELPRNPTGKVLRGAVAALVDAQPANARR